MRTHRLIPVVIAGIAILGSGCAKTSTPPGADSTMHRDSVANVPQNPVNNAVGQTDNNNVRSNAADSAIARGARSDSTARSGSPTHP